MNSYVLINKDGRYGRVDNGIIGDEGANYHIACCDSLKEADLFKEHLFSDNYDNKELIEAAIRDEGFIKVPAYSETLTRLGVKK